jgi:hypothetical protein
MRSGLRAGAAVSVADVGTPIALNSVHLTHPCETLRPLATASPGRSSPAGPWNNVHGCSQPGTPIALYLK